jgi:hypothetical protein
MTRELATWFGVTGGLALAGVLGAFLNQWLVFRAEKRIAGVERRLNDRDRAEYLGSKCKGAN